MPTKDVLRGRDASLFAFRTETAPGTLPADGPYVRSRFYTHGLSDSRAIQSDPVLGAPSVNSRDIADTIRDLPEGQGNVQVPMCFRQSGWFFAMLCGYSAANNTTDNMDGTWTHVFDSGARQLPCTSLAFRSNKTGDADEARAFRMAVLDSLGISVAKEGGFVMLDLGFMHGEPLTLDGASAPTFADALGDAEAELTYFPVPKILAAALIDDAPVGDFLSSQLTLRNALERDQGLNASPYPSNFIPGETEGSGSTTVRYVDTTFIDIGANETEQKLGFRWASGTSSVLIEFNNAEIPINEPGIEGPGAREQQIQFMAKQNGELPAWRISLTNDVASYDMPAAA